MYYKGYVIADSYFHYNVTDLEGNFICSTDTVEEAMYEIDDIICAA